MSISSVSAGYRRLFYLVTPNETSFEKIENVPGFVEQAFPYFISLIFIESVILFLQGRQLPRANDGMSSLNAGLLSLLHSLLFRPVELSAFVWVYEKFNIITLPWEAPWAWLLCLVGIDFAYYWVHRFGHEVNIVWAAHQTHHSSEDYNFTTALRQSTFQKYFAWVFYLPLALVLPPSLFLVHIQLNLLYQFWVHTEIVRNLGPLEYIICTPSHHRVHHGRNPYCIDKNYGGVLIIWDRLFGTFEAERSDEEIAYGLVHSLNSWSPIYAQFCHLLYMLGRLTEVGGISSKLSVAFKGPGWSQGKPRLGLPEDIPQVEFPVVKYDSTVSSWKTVYIWSHFVICVLFYLAMVNNAVNFPPVMIYLGVTLIITSVTSFGALYDNRWYGLKLECGRCCASIVYLWMFWSHLTLYMYIPHVLTGLYCLSLIPWTFHSLTLAVYKPLGYFRRLTLKTFKKYL